MALTPTNDDFLAMIANPVGIYHELLDMFPDIIFDIKDRSGRFVVVTSGLVKRLQIATEDELLGKTVHDVFPPTMANRYAAQDNRVLQTGEPLRNNLDVTTYPSGGAGWCHTSKIPVRNHHGEIIGIACLSKDLQEEVQEGWLTPQLAKTVDYILEHYNKPLKLAELAEMACLTIAQLERRMRKVFQVTPKQFILRARLEAAIYLLMHADKPISEIAYECGFSDQSALTRGLRQFCGQTPGEMRRKQRQNRT